MTDNNIIALIDMDCFYCQVEQRLNPALKGKPCAVVQYNTWKGGGIIAVSYEARALGVSRQMRGDDAKSACPSIELVRVPEVRGKAVLTRYRDAGAEVIDVLTQFSSCVQRASVDEAFVDITKEVDKACNELTSLTVRPDDPLLASTFLGGASLLETDLNERSSTLVTWLNKTSTEDPQQRYRYVEASRLVQRMRTAVEDITGFQCSAGIAPNKMLAKLACGLHKPNKQTVVPPCSINSLLSTVPIKKIRNLGGKFGSCVMQKLNVEKIGEVTAFSELDLQTHFGEKDGSWLYNLCRGIDYECVKSRRLAQSIGCGKNFPGKQALDSKTKVNHWLQQLSEEIIERLIKDRDMNMRIARSLHIGAQFGDSSPSRVCALVRYDPVKLAADSLALLREFNTAPVSQDTWSPCITGLRMVATKFQDKETSRNIQSMLENSRTLLPSSTPSSLTSASVSLSSSLEPSNAHDTNKITTFFRPRDSNQYSEERNLKENIKTRSKSSSMLYEDDSSSSNQGTSFFKRLLAESEDKPSVLTSPTFPSSSVNHRSSSVNHSKRFIPAVVSVSAEELPCSSKQLAETPNATVYDLSDYITCPECGERVLMWSMPEHSDYHLAATVEKAWKQETDTRQPLKQPKKLDNSHDLKRKKGRPSKTKHLETKLSKSSVTLDNFFYHS